MLLIGDNATINIDSKEVTVDNATYVLHQASVRGLAKTLHRDTNGKILIEDASYTGCQPSDDFWQLNTSEITLIKNLDLPPLKMLGCISKMCPFFIYLTLNFPLVIVAPRDCYFHLLASTKKMASTTLSRFTGI